MLNELSERLRCAICGQFMSVEDANFELISPDSDLTSEEWDVTHKACRAAELARAQEAKPEGVKHVER